jgi:hypothetical protein
LPEAYPQVVPRKSARGNLAEDQSLSLLPPSLLSSKNRDPYAGCFSAKTVVRRLAVSILLLGDLVFNSTEACKAIPGAGLTDGGIIHDLITLVTKSPIASVQAGEIMSPAMTLDSFPMTNLLDVFYIVNRAKIYFDADDLSREK